MNKFPISCWTYFSINQAWPTLAKDYHDLGLTNPMTPVFSDGDDPQKMLRLLDEFHALDTKVILFDARVTARIGVKFCEEDYRKRFALSLEQFGNHPAVMGFYVGDEPDAPDAEHFFAVARVQREMAPHLMPFLNLLPWFDWIGERIGSPEYAPYLDRAVMEGNLSQIGYDCYTQMWEGDSGYDVYFNNLREMRDCSNRHGIPYCVTLLSSGHYDYACPDQDAYRWQISTSAALGAKALTYFYVCGIGCGDNYRQFPINHFKERSVSYSWLSEENRFFLDKHADLLLGLKCEKSEFTLKAYGGLGEFSADETLLSATNGKGVNMLVSKFTDSVGNVYRAVVNMDRKINIAAELNFAPGVKVERKFWGERWINCSGYSDAVGARDTRGASVTMWMAPGQMEIIRETKL
ncbi:MAG: hypothetical protein II350_00425 [Clostridia bacterium]|nr:hypothetical protein [Clostridia bacterium]